MSVLKRAMGLALTGLVAGATLLAPAAGAMAAPESNSGHSHINVDVNMPGTSGGSGGGSGNQQTEDFTITNAELRWGINVEANSGAYFGGCNWIQAGEAGNNGGSSVWSDDSLYSNQSGNTSIEKIGPGGQWVEQTWANKCQDLSEGTPRNVTTQPTETGTKTEFVMVGGQGEFDASEQSLRIEWEGSFSVVFYGGMTYWWARNPVLEIKDGVGSLTADLGGYGADMFDTSRWIELDVHEDVPLASLKGVEFRTDTNNGEPVGIVHTPEYRGVAIDVEANGPSNPQRREGSNWGSFPQEFVDFQVLTGQAGYWYTSGGQRDPAKPPTDIFVSFDATKSVGGERNFDLDLEDSSNGLGGLSGGGLQQPTLSGGTGSGTTTAAAPVAPGTTSYEPLDLTGLLAALAGSSSPADAAPTGATGAVGTAPSLQDVNWLGSGLIPDEVANFVRDYEEAFWWALAGLLALGGLTGLAFWKGWLVLPWKTS